MLAVEDAKVFALEQAIEKAEGFGPPENLPTRINNPCDLELGDRGFGVEAGKTIFPSLIAGRAAAMRECWLMLTGNSHFYNPSKTFLQIAILFTGGDNPMAWATIVSGALGLTPENTLQDFLGTRGGT